MTATSRCTSWTPHQEWADVVDWSRAYGRCPNDHRFTVERACYLDSGKNSYELADQCTLPDPDVPYENGFVACPECRRFPSAPVAPASGRSGRERQRQADDREGHRFGEAATADERWLRTSLSHLVPPDARTGRLAPAAAWWRRSVGSLRDAWKWRAPCATAQASSTTWMVRRSLSRRSTAVSHEVAASITKGSVSRSL